MVAVRKALESGWKSLEAGDLPRAEQAARSVLRDDRGNAEAWVFLGAIRQTQGQWDEAVSHFKQAVKLDPRCSDSHRFLGSAYLNRGDLERAEASLHKALRLDPESPGAHVDLGTLLSRRGKPDEAVASYRKALRLDPDLPEALANLSGLLVGRGKADEAAALALRAVQARPTFAEGHHALGVALWRLGRRDEAARAFGQALALRPALLEALMNLAPLLRELNRPDEAEECLRRAVALGGAGAEAPYALGVDLCARFRYAEAADALREAVRLRDDWPDAWYQLGLALRGARDRDGALAALRRALELRTDHADARFQEGVVLHDLNRLDDARTAFRAALALRPDMAHAYVNFGNLELAQGNVDEALRCYQESLRFNPKEPVAHSCYAMALNYKPGLSPAALLEEHRRWAAQHCPPPPAAPHANDRSPGRRLRVGYVSQDFRLHVTGHFVEPILAYHDHGPFEIVAYPDVTQPDDVTERFRGRVDRWHPLAGVPDDQAAELIRSHQVDVLVDLNGHTGSRLGIFARKPAPVQVTYVGYANTTGLAAVDYRLTDAVADPEGEPRCHSEELVRLPGGFCCYWPSADAPEVSPPPLDRKGHVTFGSFHGLAKLNAGVLDLWAALLRAVPDARLLILRDAMTGSARERLVREFAARGIGAGRLDLRNSTPPGMNHHATYAELDVSLDVLPWSGHTTSCESLWMGVPVVTLAGVPVAWWPAS
jgi:predicted O-linked N-acetylglucosamine transferase (SPINDLY family)